MHVCKYCQNTKRVRIHSGAYSYTRLCFCAFARAKQEPITEDLTDVAKRVRELWLEQYAA